MIDLRVSFKISILDASGITSQGTIITKKLSSGSNITIMRILNNTGDEIVELALSKEEIHDLKQALNTFNFL